MFKRWTTGRDGDGDDDIAVVDDVGGMSSSFASGAASAVAGSVRGALVATAGATEGAGSAMLGFILLFFGDGLVCWRDLLGSRRTNFYVAMYVWMLSVVRWAGVVFFSGDMRELGALAPGEQHDQDNK